MNLNKRSVEGLTAKSKRYFAWDTTLKGLAFGWSPAGGRPFFAAIGMLAPAGSIFSAPLGR